MQPQIKAKYLSNRPLNASDQGFIPFCSSSSCQQQLPATGVPITRQRFDQMRSMFEEYVRNRTGQNWKFWIVSFQHNSKAWRGNGLVPGMLAHSAFLPFCSGVYNSPPHGLHFQSLFVGKKSTYWGGGGAAGQVIKLWESPLCVSVGSPVLSL